MLDMLLVRKTLSVHDWMYALWGGRAVTGVYWYITCFLFTLFLLSTLLKKFSDRTIKSIALIGGGISVIESHLIDKIHLLQSPGVPWNLDVSLMALIYLSIGFFIKIRSNSYQNLNRENMIWQQELLPLLWLYSAGLFTQTVIGFTISI